MVGRKLVKGGINYFALFIQQTSLEIRNFFRSFIHQQHNHFHLRIMLLDAVGYFLKQHCLACLRRRYDQTSLTFAYWCYQIYYPEGQLLPAVLHHQLLIRENRCQGAEIRPSYCRTRLLVIYAYHIQKRSESGIALRRSAYSFYLVPRLQIESSYLSRGNIYILVTGEEVVESQESESILCQVQNALCLVSVISVRHHLFRHLVPLGHSGAPLLFGLLPGLCSG